MKINNQNQYSPSFSAQVVHNRALRTLVRDVKNMYGEKYLRTATKKLGEIGTQNDKVEFVFSTWTYQKGIGTTPRKEGVTFVLVNDKHIGHFENRFVSNILANISTYLKTLPKRNYIHKTPRQVITSKKNGK